MFYKIRTLSLGLACGGLTLLMACPPVTPPKTDATWDMENTKIEFSYEKDADGNPVYISEGWTDLYLNGYYYWLREAYGYDYAYFEYPNARVKINAALNNFTIRKTKEANYPEPPGVTDGYTDDYDPGCTDTYWSRETIAGGGIIFWYYQPKWNPYDCPGPETDGSESWDEWNSNGHIQVYLNGIYVGAGYSNEFELDLLRQPLFYTPDEGYGSTDHNGVIQPWEDLNDDGMVDIGKDWDIDGVIRGADSVEPDSDGDGWFDIYEPDRDLDGQCDLVDEDLDGDTNLDVNEDDPANGGNGNGVPDHGEDLDCDGNFDVNEIDPETGCWTDIDGDGRVDYQTEDVNGDGVLEPGADPDIDGDCRVDMADEDINGDGHLDVNEDIDGDGLCNQDPSQSEDLDGDGIQDVNEEELVPQDCPRDPENEFGCEGDDVTLIHASDYLMGISQLYFGHDGFYTYDSVWYDICEPDVPEQLHTILTLKLVHDDHSDIYGAPVLNYELTKDDMLATGLLTCYVQDEDTYEWIKSDTGEGTCVTPFSKWLDYMELPFP